eukprot:s1202_g17.t1
MFDQRRAAREDAQLLVYMMYAGALQFVPRQYRSDPLRAFLWLAVRRKELLPEGHRSCFGFSSSLVHAVGPGGPAAEWLHEVRGTVAGSGGHAGGVVAPCPGCARCSGGGTSLCGVVRYQQDESQVPHIDTSDVTMLVYLSSSGGNTCFPNLQRSIMPRAGRVLVFCSTTPGASRFGGFAGSAYGVPKDDTMHFGGLCPSRGEKLIVQLLFAALDPSLKIGSWDEALCGRALRQASYSSGVEAQPLPAVPSASRLPRLATSPQRCATGCKGPALDLEVAQRGEAKVCIHCWQRRLQALRGS